MSGPVLNLSPSEVAFVNMVLETITSYLVIEAIKNKNSAMNNDEAMQEILNINNMGITFKETLHKLVPE
jgi:hypothetical protein